MKIACSNGNSAESGRERLKRTCAKNEKEGGGQNPEFTSQRKRKGEKERKETFIVERLDLKFSKGQFFLGNAGQKKEKRRAKKILFKRKTVAGFNNTMASDIAKRRETLLNTLWENTPEHILKSEGFVGSHEGKKPQEGLSVKFGSLLNI